MEERGNDNNENNQNQNNQGFNIDNQVEGREFLTARDIKNLAAKFFPSLGFLIGSSVALGTNSEFCVKNYDILLKIITFFYTLVIFKTIIHFILTYFNISSQKPAELSLTTTDVLLELGYFGLVITTYYLFNKKPEKCFNENIFATIFLFCFILIGVINFSRYILNFLIIVICFPVLVCYFFQSPTNFYNSFGVDPEIISNLPTIKAKVEHCTTCVICSIDIKEGDEILVLKCPGHHYFHGNCIKGWLHVKLECPLCRSTNVF